MPRNRMIRPEIWSSEQFGDLSMGARLLWIAMWGFGDDYGVVKYKPRQLKVQAFGYDDITEQDIKSFIEEMIATGLVEWFENEDSIWLHTINFLKYQRIDRPSKTRNPDPEQHVVHNSSLSNDINGLGDDSTRTRRALIPKLNKGKLKEVKLSEVKLSESEGNNSNVASDSMPSPSQQQKINYQASAVLCIDHLNESANRQYKHAHCNTKRVIALLKEGHSINEIFAVIDAKVLEWGKNPDMSKYLRPATLFHKDKFNQYVGMIGVSTQVDFSEMSFDEQNEYMNKQNNSIIEGECEVDDDESK